jgi:hypothetical protein
MEEAQARLRYLQLKAKAAQSAPPPPPPEAKGNLYAFGSGAVRSIPQGLDLAGAAVAEGASRMTGGDGGYFKGFMQPAMTPADDLVTAAIGPEYEAQGLGENVSKIGGAILGPGGALKGIRNLAGLIKGLGGSLDNYIRDPNKLKEAYQAWESGLEKTEFARKYLKDELVQPFLEKMKFDLPTMTDPKALEAVQAIEKVQGLPNARYLEGARRNLSGNPTRAAQVGRQQIDQTMEAAGIGLEGRDAYRRAMTYEDLQQALRNKGNQRIQAVRTKINNMDEAGMSEAEIAAKTAAGTQGLGESALRAFDGVGNVVLSGLSTYGAGPVAGMAQYLAGKGLGKLGDKVAEGKINVLKDVLLNQRTPPNMGEKAGAALRKVLQGK